jgi:hypothetical protein
MGHVPQEEIAEKSANDLRGWLARTFAPVEPAGAPLIPSSGP